MDKQLYGLHKRFHRKFARDLVDIDYADSLPHDVQIWLAQFLDEYYGDRYPKDKKPIHNKEQKRTTGQANNERRRDLFATGLNSGPSKQP